MARNRVWKASQVSVFSAFSLLVLKSGYNPVDAFMKKYASLKLSSYEPQNKGGVWKTFISSASSDLILSVKEFITVYLITQ